MGGRLAACPGLDGRRVETLNFAVSGYSTAQSLIVLRRKVWRYDPDLVLLALYVGNDVQDNSLALSGYARRPYFRLRGDALTLEDGFRRDPRFRLLPPLWTTVVDPLIDRSRVLKHLDEMRRKGLPDLGFARAPAGYRCAGRAQDPGIGFFVRRKPRPGARPGGSPRRCCWRCGASGCKRWAWTPHSIRNPGSKRSRRRTE